MAEVRFFSHTDLRRVKSFDDVVAALTADQLGDVAYFHTTPSEVALTPEGLQPGINVFGPGHSSVITNSPVSLSNVRAIATVVLNDCFYCTNSLSILDRNSKLFLPGIENIGNPQKLAEYDPSYSLNEENHLNIKDSTLAMAKNYDIVAIPVCAAGFPNYGHFLYDGLPAAFMLSRLIDHEKIRLVGQPLRPWQRQILAALGLDDLYLEVKGVVRFRKIVASTMLALHVSYPSAFVRPVFDFLRFRFGVPAPKPGRRLFVSRGESRKRWLLNRDDVERAVAKAGFEIVHPETLPFAEQVALFSQASVVAGESGAALANLGFCPPGTAVLEIQPEIFSENWTRAMCFLFAHRWHVYLAEVVQKEHLPNGESREGTDLAYRVDPASLTEALAAVDRKSSLLHNEASSPSLLPPATPIFAPATRAATPSTPIPVKPEVGPSLSELARSGGAPEIMEVAPTAVVHRVEFFWADPIDEKVAPFKAQMTDSIHRSYTSARISVHRLEDVVVAGSDQIVFHKNEVLRNSVSGISYWEKDSIVQKFISHKEITLKHPVPIHSIDDTKEYFIGCDPAWRNYALWMRQALPKLVIYSRHFMQQEKMRLVLPHLPAGSYQEQTLRLLGISEDRIVHVGPNEALALPVGLVMTPIDGWSIPPFSAVAAQTLARAAAEAAGVQVSKQRPQRIFLRRGAQAVRHVVNVAELEPTLKKFDFVSVDFANLSVAEQILTIRNATHVVAEHGAGLANVMFCTNRPAVMELFNPCCVQPAFWTVSGIAGCSFGFMVGRHIATNATPTPTWNTNYSIDPLDFEKALATMTEARNCPHDANQAGVKHL